MISDAAGVILKKEIKLTQLVNSWSCRVPSENKSFSSHSVVSCVTKAMSDRFLHYKEISYQLALENETISIPVGLDQHGLEWQRDRFSEMVEKRSMFAVYDVYVCVYFILKEEQ